VIVTTSSDYFASHQLVYDYIIPAVKSDVPLAPNPGKAGLLTITVCQLASSTGESLQPVPQHPELAKKINGITFNLEPNAADWVSMTFHFADRSCQLTLGTTEEHTG